MKHPKRFTASHPVKPHARHTTQANVNTKSELQYRVKG